VEQDPVYLRNQSRRLHNLYRRNRRFLNGFAILWCLAFGALLMAALLDRATGLGWGFSPSDPLNFLGFLAFAGVFWLFSTIIAKINLAYVRHTYGPEPVDD
jgi:hypothetical protein